MPVRLFCELLRWPGFNLLVRFFCVIWWSDVSPSSHFRAARHVIASVLFGRVCAFSWSKQLMFLTGNLCWILLLLTTVKAVGSDWARLMPDCPDLTSSTSLFEVGSLCSDLCLHDVSVWNVTLLTCAEPICRVWPLVAVTPHNNV